jgi:hypothetical protein
MHVLTASLTTTFACSVDAPLHKPLAEESHVTLPPITSFDVSNQKAVAAALSFFSFVGLPERMTQIQVHRCLQRPEPGTEDCDYMVSGWLDQCPVVTVVTEHCANGSCNFHHDYLEGVEPCDQ